MSAPIAQLLIAPANLLLHPRRGWQRLATAWPRNIASALLFPAIFALLPAIAWYSGTTRIGWSIGTDSTVRLTQGSALPIVVLFYLAMVGAVLVIGFMMHWMARTYGATSTLAQGIAIAGFTATPLFLAGLVGFYPLILVDLLIGLAALSYSVYLLYVGLPIAMDIPEERGFLFASAAIAVCLVIFIAIMGASVLLWDMGATPVFTD